jgi:acid stress-induced BolA-like protein IbaG/YrbA
MADTAEIKTLLHDALPGAEVSVTDMQGGDHLYAHVKAPQFDGLSLIAQHKLVYAPVQHLIDDGSIHALKIKTEVAT